MITSYPIGASRPVVIVGAGPIGLAAAAKCVRRGIAFCLLEAGERAATAVSDWRHVRLFSPWSDCIDSDARALLEESGWIAPPGDAFPSGHTLIQAYLRPLAELPAILAELRYGARVTAIERRAQASQPCHAGFLVTTEAGDSLAAAAVIDASGTWSCPRRLPRTGPPVSKRVHERVPDLRAPSWAKRLAGKRVAIVGSGHSGMTLLIDLVDSAIAGEIVWVRRGNIAHAGVPSGPGSARARLEQRAEEAASERSVHVLDGVTISQLREMPGAVLLGGCGDDGAPLELEADYVFTPIGFDCDHGIARGLDLALDPQLLAPRGLASLIDPARHGCDTVPAHGWKELSHPEHGYFIAGAKSYGRAPNFALTTGYRQLDSILAHLASDRSRPRGVRGRRELSTGRA